MTVLRRLELENKFRDNELVALKTYKGQRFYISGFVRDLSVSGDTTTLTLGVNDLDSAGCACSSQDNLLLKIKARAQSVALLEGTCVGSVYFNDCRVIDVLIREEPFEPKEPRLKQPPPTPMGIVGKR